MFFITDILIWFLLWASIWLIFWSILSKRFNINYLDKYYITALYFLASSLLVWAVFPGITKELLGEVDPVGIFIVALLMLFNVYVYKFCNTYFIRPQEFLHKQKYQSWLSMDKRFIFSKTFEIAFQQLMVGLLTFMLFDAGFMLTEIIIVFALIFGLVHVPLLKLISKAWALYFIVGAVVSAVAFPTLILSVSQGIVWSFVVHFLFYTLSGVVVWFIVSKRKKLVI